MKKNDGLMGDFSLQLARMANQWAVSLYKKIALANTHPMRKTLLVLLAAVCLNPLQAADKAAYFTSLRRASVLPVVAGLGQVADKTDTNPLLALKEALGTPYDFKWTQDHMDPEKRKALSHLHNDLLRAILPAGTLYFGEPAIHNGVCGVAVLLPESKIRLDILISVQTHKILYIKPSEVEL